MPWTRLLAQLPTPTIPIAIFPIHLAHRAGGPPVHERAPYTQRGEKSKSPGGEFYFLRKRDGGSGGISCSGWIRRAFARSCSSVSGSSGFGTQQSTGQTAAHCSWSKKPTHSVHFSGTM